ncbi:MAG: hypothetical protein ACOX56_01260 [Acholeplasmataceae bacterium]|jgi:hypothetical protein
MVKENITNRVAYIISYSNKAVLKRLEKLPVRISYISEANKQVLVYFDRKQKKDVENQLKRVKGFIGMEESALFQEDVLNF